MENKRDQIELLANTFNKYREDVEISLKNGNIIEHRFVLQEQLFKELRNFDIDLSKFRTSEYINKLSFGPKDKTYLTIQNIENQISDIFDNKTQKTAKEIFTERDEYIDTLLPEQQQKYKDLRKDPLLYLLIGGTYEPNGNEGKVGRVIDERQLSKDLIENKEKINKISDLVSEYRKSIVKCNNIDEISDLQNQYAKQIENLGMEFPLWDDFYKFMDQILFNGKEIYKHYKKDFKDVNEEDIVTISELKVLYKLKEDPIYHLFSGSTPQLAHLYAKVIDDDKLAQALVDFNN